jgi:ectoine hydroxylase-related dioxygenase (phytanoyl-CoA dioxygenase family)
MESSSKQRILSVESQSKFHKTFTVDQEKELREFFLENGYVAVRDVLTAEECDKTLAEVNDQMKSMNSNFDINDISTYEHAPIVNNWGMYTKRPIFTKQFLENRQNPKIYKALCILYGHGDLIVNHDRSAFYRPTKGLILDGKECDKPEWKINYTYPGLHLDFHPGSYFKYADLVKRREAISYTSINDFMAENNMYCEADGLQIQGVINLMDNYEDDGGYQCMPKFTKFYDEWVLEKNKFIDSYGEGVYPFSNSDKIDMKYVNNPTRIPVPKGTIILWSQILAHGSKPNNSNRPRCIQFIKAFPKLVFSKERMKKRSACLKKVFSEINFVPNDVGKIVFNL